MAASIQEVVARLFAVEVTTDPRPAVHAARDVAWLREIAVQLDAAETSRGPGHGQWLDDPLVWVAADWNDAVYVGWDDTAFWTAAKAYAYQPREGARMLTPLPVTVAEHLVGTADPAETDTWRYAEIAVPEGRGRLHTAGALATLTWRYAQDLDAPGLAEVCRTAAETAVTLSDTEATALSVLLDDLRPDTVAGVVHGDSGPDTLLTLLRPLTC